jgi:hypothetical protein
MCDFACAGAVDADEEDEEENVYLSNKVQTDGDVQCAEVSARQESENHAFCVLIGKHGGWLDGWMVDGC